MRLYQLLRKEMKFPRLLEFENQMSLDTITKLNLVLKNLAQKTTLAAI